MALAPSGNSVPSRPRANRKSPRRSRAKRADPSARDDSVYTEYGIELKTWFAENTSGRITYLVSAWPWHYERRIIERDGLVSFQVTIHLEKSACWTCKERVAYVTEQLAEANGSHFWTREADNCCLY